MVAFSRGVDTAQRHSIKQRLRVLVLGLQKSPPAHVTIADIPRPIMSYHLTDFVSLLGESDAGTRSRRSSARGGGGGQGWHECPLYPARKRVRFLGGWRCRVSGFDCGTRQSDCRSFERLVPLLLLQTTVVVVL